jgi:hypothetical protein
MTKRLMFLVCGFTFLYLSIPGVLSSRGEQQAVCGFVLETTWDCRIFFDSLGMACGSTDCDQSDESNPVCGTWATVNRRGQVGAGPKGLWNSYDPLASTGDQKFSEIKFEWKSCGFLEFCSTECEVQPDGNIVCKRNIYMPQIPLGGYHATLKGPCPFPNPNPPRPVPPRLDGQMANF